MNREKVVDGLYSNLNCFFRCCVRHIGICSTLFSHIEDFSWFLLSGSVAYWLMLALVRQIKTE